MHAKSKRSCVTQVTEKFRGVLDPAQLERLSCLKLDLMSTSSVRNFASELLAQTSAIHVLLNNGKSLYRIFNEKEGTCRIARAK